MEFQEDVLATGPSRAEDLSVGDETIFFDIPGKTVVFSISSWGTGEYLVRIGRETAVVVERDGISWRCTRQIRNIGLLTSVTVVAVDDLILPS